MKNEKIKSLIMNELKLKQVYVTGDDNHIKIVAVGERFNGISPVKRQQIVYKPLIQMIKDKHIHAVSIFSYTLDEWKKINNSKDIKVKQFT
jgi:acid stress-induced BolA-like protein IbaG/YrbA